MAMWTGSAYLVNCNKYIKVHFLHSEHVMLVSAVMGSHLISPPEVPCVNLASSPLLSFASVMCAL